MEPVGSLPCSQEPSTGPYPEPDQSSPYHPILSKIYFNIIHPPQLLQVKAMVVYSNMPGLSPTQIVLVHYSQTSSDRTLQKSKSTFT
jgi:hypothetical protein